MKLIGICLHRIITCHGIFKKFIFAWFLLDININNVFSARVFRLSTLANGKSPYLEFAHIKLILDTLLNLQFFLIMLNWYRLKFAHWGGKGKSKTGANTM